MAYTLVQYRIVSASATLGAAFTSPPTAGSLLLACVENRDEIGPGPLSDPPPTGWTRVPLAAGASTFTLARNVGLGQGHGDLLYRVCQAGDTGIAYAIGVPIILMEWSGFVGNTPIDAAKAQDDGNHSASISMVSGAPGKRALVIGGFATRLRSTMGGACAPSAGTNQVPPAGVQLPTTGVLSDSPVVLYKESTDGAAVTLEATQSGTTKDNEYWWGGRIVAFETPDPSIVCDFVGTPLLGTAPMLVEFTDLSTNSPTSWEWDFGDGYTSTEQNPVHVYSEAGVYTVSLTATNNSGSDTETKVAYVVVYEPNVVDLTNTICYNNYCFGFTFPAGGGPGQGSYIRQINISDVEAVGYEDKRALQDGFDAADVFLGRRHIVIDAAIYGSTIGAAFDELALLKDAFHPVSAFEADETNLGFLPLDYYRPTADIVTWPLSAYPSGIPQRIYCRPDVPVRDNFVRERMGGVNEKGLAMTPQAVLWARDPRVYLQELQTVSLSASTQTMTYRGNYESWPIVSFTMTAAGNSACQIVVSGGTVKLNLSATTTGTYELDYMNRTITNTADGTLYESLFSPVDFAQSFKQVKPGSTAYVSSTTGMSAITITYREAFV